MLKARALAGDTAAVEYNEAFHNSASQNEKDRWELLHNKIWLVVVGPNIKGKSELSRLAKWGSWWDPVCRIALRGFTW